MLCEIDENPIFKSNVRRRLSVSDGKIPSVGISCSENKRTPRGLLKAL